MDMATVSVSHGHTPGAHRQPGLTQTGHRAALLSPATQQCPVTLDAVDTQLVPNPRALRETGGRVTPANTLFCKDYEKEVLDDVFLHEPQGL